MLGVFGSVPAFDANFKRACKPEGLVATFGAGALRKIGAFCKGNAAIIDAYRVPTLDFVSGEHTRHFYTRAKVIDMALFIEGEKLDESAKLSKFAAAQSKLLT